MTADGAVNPVRDFILTASGGVFFPLAPKIEDIRIEDIAHSLAQQCRFTGHTSEFYSVAEHSIHVSHAVHDQSDALWGLLHDASEAYLVDVARPVKHQDIMQPYRDAERALMRVIAERFGLKPVDEPKGVQSADGLMLSVELRDLMPRPLSALRESAIELHHNAKAQVGLRGWMGRRLVPMQPSIVKQRFLERFEELGGVE